MSFIKQYQSIPFVNIEDKNVLKKLENKPIKKCFIDVLDGDLWSSKVSFIGNVLLIILILLSTLEIILSSDTSLDDYNDYFIIINIFTSIIFTIEITGRIIYAGYIDSKNKPFKAALKYIFSFYGLIDIFSIMPFLISLFGLNSLHFLKVFRIFRIWRIARYIHAFKSISNAFNTKKEEILVSLFGVILLSLTLASFTFYAETKGGSTDFRSISDVFIWSIGKYTGDYGAIANAAPITLIGKILATINGLLGIALFAIPAGLLGSAFIDELGETKRKKEVNNRIAEIDNYFEKRVNLTKPFDNKKAELRFADFASLQARLLYTDAELLECIRESSNLRIRILKSSDDLKYPDTKLVERFLKNTSYGSRIINSNSNLYIINPVGAGERCVSHFSKTLADELKCNYISREIRMVDSNGVGINGTSSKYYETFSVTENNDKLFSSEFKEFMNDICDIKKDDIVIIINSGASGRGDFIVEYGNKKGEINFIENSSTIDNAEITTKFLESLNLNSKNIQTIGGNASQKEFSFTIDNHSISQFEAKYLSKTIRRLTKANVLTVFINIKILTDENDRYYTALNTVYKSIMHSFSKNESI